MKPNEYIVTIDFGTHNIFGVVGRVSAVGTIEILAKEEELSNGAIRRGVIIRPDDIEIAIKKIVSRLSHTLIDKGLSVVQEVFVCLSGETLRSEIFSMSRYLNGDVLTHEDIDSFIEEGLVFKSNFGNVIDVRNIEYKLDKSIIVNPLGKSGEELISKQILIFAKSRLIAPIYEIFNRIQGVQLAGVIPSPYCNSALLLTEAERQLGSILIDFGAGITSVSIFGKGRLEYFFTLPFGGNNITQDIMSVDVSFSEAERLKKRNGKAQMSHDDSKNKISTIRNHTSEALVVDAIRLNALIEARMTEIVQNIKCRVDRNNVFENSFSEGIIICGGGSQLSDVQVLIKKFFGLEVRKASVSKHLSAEAIESFNLQLEHSAVIGAILCANQFKIIDEYVTPPIASVNQKDESQFSYTFLEQQMNVEHFEDKEEQEEERKIVTLSESNFEDKTSDNEVKTANSSKPKVSFFNRIKQALNEDNNEMQ